MTKYIVQKINKRGKIINHKNESQTKEIIGNKYVVKLSKINISDLHFEEFKNDFEKIYPKIFFIVKKLIEDNNSRQCVIIDWEKDELRKKYPSCIIALQFLIRERKIHTILYLRSSEVKYKLKQDMKFAKFITEKVLDFLKLENEFKHIELGDLIIFQGSAHYYLK